MDDPGVYPLFDVLPEHITIRILESLSAADLIRLSLTQKKAVDWCEEFLEDFHRPRYLNDDEDDDDPPERFFESVSPGSSLDQAILRLLRCMPRGALRIEAGEHTCSLTHNDVDPFFDEDEDICLYMEGEVGDDVVIVMDDESLFSQLNCVLVGLTITRDDYGSIDFGALSNVLIRCRFYECRVIRANSIRLNMTDCDVDVSEIALDASSSEGITITLLRCTLKCQSTAVIVSTVCAAISMTDCVVKVYFNSPAMIFSEKAGAKLKGCTIRASKGIKFDHGSHGSVRDCCFGPFDPDAGWVGFPQNQMPIRRAPLAVAVTLHGAGEVDVQGTFREGLGFVQEVKVVDRPLQREEWCQCDNCS